MQIKTIVLTALLSLTTLGLFAQQATREEYILKYKDLAAGTMERYGIPASIVMAQALLESGSGNSRLAREANNHFGIKCGGNWPGETITHHDDARDECFRVYATAGESFLDHGKFLDGSSRYSKLFDLSETDYTGWAHGLQECGYATNPDYGPMLVRIIEDHKLYLLDQGVNVAYVDIRTERAEVAVDESAVRVDVDRYTVTIDRLSGRGLHYNNGVPYVVAQAGDTFATLARDFRIGVKKLLKFNDLTPETLLAPGEAVYVGRKNRRSETGNLYVVKAGDTLHGISQQQGIRLKSLHRLNRLSPDIPLRDGQSVRLR